MIENEGIAESGGFKNWALDQTSHLLLVTLLTKLNVSGFECFWRKAV